MFNPIEALGKNIGRNAVEGAIKRIEEKAQRFSPDDFFRVFPAFGGLAGMYNDIKGGYEKMTPDEKSEFWKNLLIAGAKLGARL